MEIDKIIYRLSKEITESEFTNPLLLGIPRRGDLIAKRISKNLDHLNYAHDIDTVDYLMTGKLPRDGNHDGMKDHKPVEGHVRRDLDALD